MIPGSKHDALDHIRCGPVVCPLSFGRQHMTQISTTARKFHFGLNVTDLDRSVEFYRVLFGVPPLKHFADYAKFEVADPPLVLALHPNPQTPGGALNHVGFRVKSSDALVTVQHRLELAGIRTQREDGVECCYARQTKFWVPDADRNLWEIYTLEEDLDHSGFGGDGAGMPQTPKSAHASVTWSHLLTAPLPEQIPHDDQSVAEVHLEGTFNLQLTADRRRDLIAEIHRVLRPGGMVSVHGLVADKPFPGKPALPGPAALVQYIPVETEAHEELSKAGFVGLNFDKLGDIHCFQAGGVELREMRFTAVKPLSSASDEERFVLYRGPLLQVTDELGNVYPRGVRVRVDEATWALFHQPQYAEHFTCFRCAAQVLA